MMLHLSVKRHARPLVQSATATPARQLVGVLALTSVVGMTMLVFRMFYGGTWGYRALPWDLFLAWLPVPLALAMARYHARERKPWPRTLLLAFAWLLFFPN